MRSTPLGLGRKGWARGLFVLLFAVLLASCRQSDEQASSTVERLPICVTPFYDAEGPQVAVGKYSDELAGADADTIETTVATMKSEWDKLRPEAMYVAAIRLFDLGLKDDGVYWFYSAQYRARLFQALSDADQLGPMGGEAFELVHAYSAFSQLTGAYINPYAFRNPKKLAETVAQVRTEGKVIPDFAKLYPSVAFVDTTQWKTLNQEVSSGMSELLEIIEEQAAAFPDGIPEDMADEEPGKPNARRIWPDPQVAALATAAQNGDVAEIDRLVAAGVDVNTQGLGRMTPLYWALRNFNKPGYKRLLEHGASPNIETADGDSVMHFAPIWFDDPQWLELALRNGGDPNLPRSRHARSPNTTPIFDAIGAGSAVAAQLLIEAGADLNQRDHENRTPLEYAIRGGKDEIAYRLLEAGADYSVETSQGKDTVALIRERVKRTEQETVWPGKVLDFIQRPYADNTPPGPDEAGDMRQ